MGATSSVAAVKFVRHCGSSGKFWAGPKSACISEVFEKFVQSMTAYRKSAALITAPVKSVCVRDAALKEEIPRCDGPRTAPLKLTPVRSCPKNCAPQRAALSNVAPTTEPAGEALECASINVTQAQSRVTIGASETGAGAAAWHGSDAGT